MNKIFRFFFTLLFVSGITILAYIFIGPPVTLYNINLAVETHKKKQLTVNIDFIQLHKNIDQQLNEQIRELISVDIEATFFAEAVDGFIDTISKKLAQSLITPQAITELIIGNKTSDENTKKDLLYFFSHVDYTLNSPSEVTAKLSYGEGKTATLLLQRKSLNWQVTNLIFPETIDTADLEKLIRAKYPMLPLVDGNPSGHLQ